MRLVAGVLALTLFASFARAEDTKTAEAPRPAAEVSHSKVPLRVVRVMPESRQALLFDRARATHVLAEVGGKIDGYTVEAIDDDEVTLTLEGKQIVLVAPARAGDRRRDRDAAAMHVRSAAGAKQPDTSVGDPAPVDPYGEPAIRVVEAPGATEQALGGQPSRTIEPGEGGVRVAQAPSGTGGVSGAETSASQAGLPEIRSSGIRIVSAPPGANGAPAPDAHTASAPAADARTSSGPAADARTADARTADARTADARTADARTADARTATADARTADERTADARTADARTADAPARETGIRVVEAPAGVAGAQTTDSPALATSARSAGVSASAARTAARTPVPRTPDVRVAAADKQTLDARALADIMTADGRGRAARKPASASLDYATARPATTGQPVSEIRTTAATAAPADATVLARSDVDGALADFARLSGAVRGSFSASGLAVDQVADGTIFQRAGLRSGDVVTAVDGARLRSLDDAANLYARASTARAITAQIIRGGRPMTLHVAIQ